MYKNKAIKFSEKGIILNDTAQVAACFHLVSTVPNGPV